MAGEFDLIIVDFGFHETSLRLNFKYLNKILNFKFLKLNFKY